MSKTAKARPANEAAVMATVVLPENARAINRSAPLAFA
jgi:hypothetical protein